MKPSDYILGMRKEIAKQRLEEAKKNPSYEFLKTIVGSKEEEHLRSLETDDKTTFAAILAYLDETQPAVPGSVSGPRTGQAVVYLLAILSCLGIAGAYACAVWQGWLR